jgi:uncharacterized repeat protein (TIGR01451 family)
LPNAPISYAIEFGNQGSEVSCANKVSFTADENVVVDSFDFSRLSLVNAEGLPVEFQTPGGQSLGTERTVSHSVVDGSYVFDIGAEVCIPGGAKGSFEMFVRTKNNLPDSTPIATTVKIWEESAAKEDTMENNEAVSSTMVYLADVMIEKSAIVDSNADGVFSGDDSVHAVGKGKRVRYRLKYDNIGNYHAENVVLRESLPAEICFKMGSITLPERTSIEYSADKGMSWEYISSKGTGEEDCAITDFRIILEEPLMAPGNSKGGNFRKEEKWNKF